MRKHDDVVFVVGDKLNDLARCLLKKLYKSLKTLAQKSQFGSDKIFQGGKNRGANPWLAC